ncbi:MAG: hypothetical protein A2V70_09445 [Planctomycetes bacterium RBG_13_63_9]|nr:MAG: hypothetical protein A2V70_09445 [Planctomycetes bacterium RBG_13_63_9]
MRRLFPILLTAGAVVIVPLVAAAQDVEDKQPGPPGPEQLFKRLDANQDGKVTVDEIPDGAPDRLKAMLKRADANGDKELTLDEMTEARKKFREAIDRRRAGRPDGPPAMDRDGPRRPGRRAGPPDMDRDGPLDMGRDGPRRHGPPDMDRDGPRRHGRRPGPPPFAGRGPRGHGPPGVGPVPPLPNPAVVFKRLDKDGDKQLSLDEFAAGMKRLHQRMGRPPAGMAHPFPMREHVRKGPWGPTKKAAMERRAPKKHDGEDVPEPKE